MGLARYLGRKLVWTIVVFFVALLLNFLLPRLIPGNPVDAIDAFTYGFTKGGGKMLDPIRVPMGTVDFSSYFQHVQENKPDCLVGFMPGGPMSIATVKDFHNRGFAKEGMELMGTVGAEFGLPGDEVSGAFKSPGREVVHDVLIPPRASRPDFRFAGPGAGSCNRRRRPKE